MFVISGILVIVSLQYFTPYFYFIPRTSLAAVIIAAVIFMVEFQVIMPMWKTKSELFAIGSLVANFIFFTIYVKQRVIYCQALSHFSPAC